MLLSMCSVKVKVFLQNNESTCLPSESDLLHSLAVSGKRILSSARYRESLRHPRLQYHIRVGGTISYRCGGSLVDTSLYR